MNTGWQSGQMNCWQCNKSLAGQRYTLEDEHPYCIKCYEQVFAKQCVECGNIISLESQSVSNNDKHWHEACLRCKKCRVSLVNQSCASKDEKLYCSNCYDDLFGTRCDECGEVFKAGIKITGYKGRKLHEKCFCCCDCKTPIGSRSFAPHDNDIYCQDCYEEKFSTRCTKCKKVIKTSGVTYNNEPWHRDCFTCTRCNTSLPGSFKTHEDKPYCHDCYGERFADKCATCRRPILDGGYSFEDRHWHMDCFKCASCKESLTSQPFYPDGAAIFCLKCVTKRREEGLGEIGQGRREDFGGPRQGQREDLGGPWQTLPQDFGNQRQGQREDFGVPGQARREDFGGLGHGRREDFGGPGQARREDFGGPGQARREDFGGQRQARQEDFGGPGQARREDFGGQRQARREDFGGPRQGRREDSRIPRQEEFWVPGQGRRENFGNPWPSQ